MKAETKVGLLFIAAILFIVGFAYYLGALSFFSNSHTIFVTYNFAGGIEVGSPVRVMGIKVGKVKEIHFDPGMKDKEGNEVKLRVMINVDKSAWETVRSDSRFYINLAGVIGEKFIEVTPGSIENELLKPGQSVRGEDPPRIDQLISQSYGLAGKIIEFVDKNEGSVIETIETMNKLVVNLNEALKYVDKGAKNKDFQKLFKNFVRITDDVAFFTGKIRSHDGQETVVLVRKLIHRLEELDGPAIKKFFQEEGIKAKLF